MRRISPEQLDSAPDDAAAHNLADLRRINAWFGGHAMLTALMRGLYHPDESFSVLDVGAASGDMGRALMRRFPKARVVSVDHHHRNLRGAEGPRVVADAFRLPFPDEQFDVTLCSLLLHHYPDPQVVMLLSAFQRLSRRAMLALDLERHAVSRAFLPATRRLFGWHPLTLHDGPVSVEAGFLPQELRALAQQAGMQNVTVRRHVPWFRLSLLWEAQDRIGGLARTTEAGRP